MEESMTKMMFDMVTFGFQNVDALILNLPTGAAKGTKGHHSLHLELMI